LRLWIRRDERDSGQRPGVTSEQSEDLKREGHVVARCTVARLMQQRGLKGAVRGATTRTTRPALMQA